MVEVVGLGYNSKVFNAVSFIDVVEHELLQLVLNDVCGSISVQLVVDQARSSTSMQVRFGFDIAEK
jgi:hypothetical protein